MDDLELAASLVREAGRLAAAMRAEGVVAEHKTNLADIVTAADHAAEALIVQRLRAARPDDSIVGEEGTDHEGVSGRTWYIDPVDGTWNFFHGLDWWCSAIALVDGELGAGGDVVLGAVHHAATDATYAGGPGLPASRNGVPLEPLSDRPLAEVGVATYLHPGVFGTPRGEAFSRAVNGAATVRFLGAGSMDAVAVAQGLLGASFQYAVPLWDRLPGEALVRSVGGVRTEVAAAGETWNIVGAPTPVRSIADSLAAER